jgi:hypothetical protein
MRKTVAIAVAVLACTGGCSDESDSAAGGTVQFAASGEMLALGGFSFPPAGAGDPAFVDGWQVRLDRMLVTVDNLTLFDNPDQSPTDQSQTGAPVARLTGPWAVDLHQAGSLPGKGGSEDRAVALATIDHQNLVDGAPFDETVRYAFGFDVVAATSSAQVVNLDAAAQADYATMVQNGWTVLYVGTATFKAASCTDTGNGAYDFTALPTVVSFKLGFKSPTTYQNCQNPDNDPAMPLGGEEHQRGVQVRSNATTIAQVTIHTGHPFWESVLHDSPAHFDQMAAQAKLVGGGFEVTLDDVVGVDFAAFTDSSGNDLPWRSCLSTYTPPDTSPVMHFDSQGVAYNPTANPGDALRDYADFMTYMQSTQGHLNADGLCFVKRNYPSPQ